MLSFPEENDVVTAFDGLNNGNGFLFLSERQARARIATLFKSNRFVVKRSVGAGGPTGPAGSQLAGPAKPAQPRLSNGGNHVLL